MSKHKNKSGAQVEEKKPVSINPDSNIGEEEILRLMYERYVCWPGSQEIPVSGDDLKKLAGLLGKPEPTKDNPFPKSKSISVIEIIGEPEIDVCLPLIKDKKLIGFEHTDNKYKLSIHGLKDTIQPPSNYTHYIIGRGSKFSTDKKNLWYACRSFEDKVLRIIDNAVSDEALLPVQAYVNVEKLMNGKKVAGTKVKLANLGENTTLEAIIGDKKYVSDGIKRPWYAAL